MKWLRKLEIIGILDMLYYELNDSATEKSVHKNTHESEDFLVYTNSTSSKINNLDKVTKHNKELKSIILELETEYHQLHLYFQQRNKSNI